MAMAMISANTEQIQSEDTPKDARLDFRSTATQKSLIEKAAALLGESVTSFVLSTLVDESLRVIREHKSTELTLRDWDAFNALLSADAEPTSKLKDALSEYERQVRT